MKRLFWIFLFLLISVPLFSQTIDEITSDMYLVERVSLCAEVDLSGIISDPDYSAERIGDYAVWMRSIDYFRADSCWFDYTCHPGHTWDGFSDSLMFKLAIDTLGIMYIGVYDPDTSNALIMLVKGSLGPVATWERPLEETDVMTGEYIHLDYSQNLLAVFLHYEYERITDDGYIISGELPILRDRLCHDPPGVYSAAYLYGFNMLNFGLKNNLGQRIVMLYSAATHRHGDGTYAGSCWYSGTPVIEGPSARGIFETNRRWCILCTDSMGVCTGTQQRGFRMGYLGAVKSAIRMTGGSNTATEAWGYLDGALRMHIYGCCTRDYASANFVTYDEFPDSIRLKTYDSRAGISSRIRMAVVCDTMFAYDVWEEPSDGFDGNPPPLFLVVEPGWNGDSLIPSLSLDTDELDFGEVLVGDTAYLPLGMENTGEDTLRITYILNTDIDIFHVYPRAGYILAGSRVDYDVRFTPPDTGDFCDTLQIYSNTPCYPIMYVVVRGRGIRRSPLEAEIITPQPGQITACSDQPIMMRLMSYPISALYTLGSSTSTVEYWNGSEWVPTYAPDPSRWGSRIIPGTEWVWDDHFSSYECVDFRAFVNIPEGAAVDSAYIETYIDDQGDISVNGTLAGSTSGDWRTMDHIDITDLLRGGEDTLEIHGCDLHSVVAGVDFMVYIWYQATCGIVPDSIQLTVNGIFYSTSDTQVTFTEGEFLSFVPVAPDSFENGDTVSVCLVSAADSCGGALELPVCWQFYVDLTPPVITGVFPPPDTIIDDPLPTVSFHLYDSISGVDTASITVSVDGEPLSFEMSTTDSGMDISCPFETPITPGDTVVVCIRAQDTPDLCPPNLLDTCFSFTHFYMELPVWLPEIFASAGDTLFIPVLCDETDEGNIVSWEFDIGLPLDILDVIDVVLDSTICPWIELSWEIDSISGALHIESSGDIPLTGEGVLVWIVVVVSQAASEGDFFPLVFLDAQFNSGIPVAIPGNGVLVINWQDVSWMLDITVDGTIPDRTEEVVTIGASPIATAGFDPGVDIIYLPPIPSVTDGYLTVSDIHYPRLRRDIRANGPFPVEWRLTVEDQERYAASWEPSVLPAGEFRINNTVDMLHTTSWEFSEDTLTIVWDRPSLAVFHLHLSPGWNLVSFPVLPVGDELFPDIGTIYEYDPVARRYEAADYITAGEGYWLLSEVDTTVVIAGMKVSEFQRAVSTGWNILGAPLSDSPTDFFTLPVWGYDPLARAYYRAVALESGKGYWMLATGDTTISVPGSGLLKPITTFVDATPPAPPGEYEQESVPEGVKGVRIFPNPFNETVNILVGSEDATVEIANLLGERVAVLPASSVSNGVSRYIWDGSGYPTGLYLVKVKTRDWIEIRRCILLK